MPELTSTAATTRNGRLVTIGLVLALIAVFAFSFALAPKAAEGEEGFVGTDSAATDVITDSHPDYEPWFSPIFEPGSGEIESGLFALQAAIGAGVVGYVAGTFRGRRKAEQVLGATPGAASGLTDQDAPVGDDDKVAV